jgi:hypothetical protein
MAISEPTSPLIAGVVSFNGLIPIFGTTGANGTAQEVQTGLMNIPSYNDWVARLNSSSFQTTGPTAAWAGEWWSVYNYLQYGGICLVGGTGSTGDYFSASGVLTASNTPLHNKSISTFDVVFDSGNTYSAQAAYSIATTRKDCIAYIGNFQNISSLPLSTTYSGQTGDFGITLGITGTEYVSFVAGRKKFVSDVGQSTGVIYQTNLSADVAGCSARAARSNNVWTSPAGKIRGRILGVVSLQQNFSTADSDYLYAGKVNPVKTFPGEGTFLMGNKTSYSGTGVLGSINVVAMLAYLKKELLNIADSFLFEVNTPELRQEFISGAVPILESIKSGNGIYSYTIVSDSSNNTSTTIAANKLIVDVILKPTATAETIVITIINSDTSEILQG